MHILLTNDDGIYAPGLRALAAELARIGSVTVVAPQTEQSGVGLSITYLHPILFKEERLDENQVGFAVGGSPADCVKLGLLELSEQPFDLVVSGINSGSNVGINTLYSGTVAGAIEGAFFGVTAIAVSLAQGTEPDYSATAKRAVTVIERLLATEPPAGSLWNLNFPDCTDHPPKGLKLTRMACKREFEHMERRTDPRGRDYFWSGLNPIENHRPTPGTDVAELVAGFVTLTPLRFDLTASEHLETHRDFTVEFSD